ncbi:MAG: hypothetical protein IKQ69_04120 [Oscillospiraceae bacterium]|nr:hypothetical protein [Oscillospiraceae bacterium]
MEIKRFPQDMSTLPVDRQDANRCLLSGLFEERLKPENGSRVFYTYLIPGLHYDRPVLMLVAPSGAEMPAWLEQSFWPDFAKEQEIFLHVLVPEKEQWDLSGADAEYMNKTYLQIQSRRSYVVIQDNVYALGLGDGAVVAQQAVMSMSSEYSGFASFGELDESAMRNAESVHGAENTGKTELNVAAAKLPTPVWMGWQENSGANAAVCRYWKAQNDAAEERYSNAWADEIYFPSTICRNSQINEEQISQVRVTNGYTGPMSRELAEAVWDFLNGACRHRGFGKKFLRRRIDPTAYGFTLHTLEHQGFTRLWYEYVPESLRGSEKNVPLVLCMHGRGSSAEAFISICDMSRVAEERNFILLIPEAGVSQQRPTSLKNLLLWEGAYEGMDIDDVGFLLRAVEDTESRLPVDKTRVYACGQSSGGMITTSLGVKAPGVFAAVSPWSALVNPDKELVLPEKIDPAVPFMFLFGDRDWLCADREHGEMEFGVTSTLAAFLRNLIKLYGLEEKPLQYSCGEIRWYVYRNEKKVPMLTVGRVANMTHANYPRESWIAYDEFLCRFSKTADGKLLYMGEEV